jgi:hypothetical protein
MCTIKHIIPLFYNRRAVKVKDVSYYDPCVDQPQRTCHTPPRRTSDATTNTNLSSPIKFTAHVSEIIYALPLPTSIPPYYAPVNHATTTAMTARRPLQPVSPPFTITPKRKTSTMKPTEQKNTYEMTSPKAPSCQASRIWRRTRMSLSDK